MTETESDPTPVPAPPETPDSPPAEEGKKYDGGEIPRVEPKAEPDNNE